MHVLPAPHGMGARGDIGHHPQPAKETSMFNTLLVALAGGPQHARVLDLAAAIAGPRSRLHLLCVLDPEFALAADASEADRIEYPEAARQRSRAEAVLAEALAELRERGRTGQAPEVRSDRDRPPPPVPPATPVRTVDRAMDHRPRALSRAGGNPRPPTLAAMASRSPLFPTRVNYRAFGRQLGRGEQALLAAIRQLREPDLRADGLAGLSDLGLDPEGCDTFITLLPLLATPAAPIDLLRSGSPFIAASELDLLVCLLRIAQWRHARPRDDDTLAPLRRQLACCAFVVHAAKLPLRQRSLSPVGLRLLDPAGWLRQR
ncbi:hypothetical protein G6F65_016028 [Rhizopus arrhizus]|nr:hypothetical protein G6F65_016028 [Rhizopus arrhizus]